MTVKGGGGWLTPVGVKGDLNFRQISLSEPP